MSKAKMTLIGLESYCQAGGDSLFKDLILPDGINKQDCIDNILLRSNEFEVLYSDPIFLKASIALWGRTWYKTFERWNQTLTEEYDPLYNYDRTEEIIEKIDEDTKTLLIGSGSMYSEDSSESKTEVDNTDTTSVSAYNTSSFDNSDKAVHDGETSSEDSSESSTTTSSRNDGTENKDIVRDHKARMFGNIGVTTSATMAQEEITLRANNVLLKLIADTFVKEFCIMVY